MARATAIRSEIQRLLHAVPFQPFVLSLENGDMITIEHPENIAFDPASNGTGGSEDFYVISGKVRLFSTFGAVTGVALIERGRKSRRSGL
jgi:hypothetical protein